MIIVKNGKFFVFIDLKTIVEEEIVKEECRRFRQTGECQFGDNCNYTHYAKEQIYQMKQQGKL